MRSGDIVIAAFRRHRFAGYGVLKSDYYRGGPSLRIPSEEYGEFEFAERADCEWTCLDINGRRWIDLHHLKSDGHHIDLLVGLSIRETDENSFLAIKRALDAAGAAPYGSPAEGHPDLAAVELEEERFEGLGKQRLSNYYERDPKLRQQAIDIHGTKCKVCAFDFETTYGDHGKDYIEIHHLTPVSRLGAATKVNPATDMVPLCSNCHRMIHRKPNLLLTPSALAAMVKKG